MLQIASWKKIAIILACLGGVLFSMPNFLSSNAKEKFWPSFLPQKTVNLGLDLRGGAHLLYQVDMDSVFKERASMIRQDLRSTLRKDKIAYKRLNVIGHTIKLELRNSDEHDAARKLIRKSYPNIALTTDVNGVIELSNSEAGHTHIVDQTISQSIEIVRRRIDELGTTEPLIQRQGDDRILVQAPGGDSQALKAVIGTTAKLSFHLLQETGKSGGWMLPDADNPLSMISVQRDALITGDMLDDAYPSDQQGRVAIGFRLSNVGARRFCDVTRNNVGRPFAIVLDEEVLSAPVIQSAICGGSGIITGNFNFKTANDLATLLRAGALPAPLAVVEERSVGPSLGADSVAAGKIAGIIGLIAVLIFMVVSYGLFGVFAAIALAINVGLLLAILSAIQATLTLPGIAGIVLTVGMAVDANVLIFERIREELKLGRSAVNAIDAGYRHAMSTIIDSNLTTLIAAFILFSFGTGPIKGFSVTLAVGIMTSFFTAIMVTRLFVVQWLNGRRPKELPI